MANKFGPSRGELKFRFAVGIAGLCLLAGIILFRGMPTGPAFFEIILIGGAFFGGTAIWAGRKLWKRDHP